MKNNLLLKPGDIVTYSPTRSPDNEYQAKILELLPGTEHWVRLEFKFPMENEVTGKSQVLVLTVTADTGCIRWPDRERAEEIIRERLSEVAAETFGLEVPTDMWGTM